MTYVSAFKALQTFWIDDFGLSQSRRVSAVPYVRDAVTDASSLQYMA